eukprot:4694850-Pleurochrysis_carterae.AAC.1
MGVENLRDQLKKHELPGKTGFALSAQSTCCSCRRCSPRPTRMRTTSGTAIPASTAAAFGAAR